MSKITSLTTSPTHFIDVITDQETGESVVLPTVETLRIPAAPNYVGGTRRNINGYGTIDISGFEGTDAELIHHIGADFTASKVPAYRKIVELVDSGDGIMEQVEKFVPVENNFFVERNDTHGILGSNVTETYRIFDFSDAIYYYMAILDQLKSRGYRITPAFAKVWDGGAKLFLQHRIGGAMIMGEPVDSYLSLVTSHDSSSGFVLALSTMRLFCANQLQRMLKNAQMKLTLRHTTNNGNRIESEANKMMLLERQANLALAEYAESLSTIKVSDQQIFQTLARIRGLDKMTTQRQVNNFEYWAGNYFACLQMPDLANFKGTAWGAYLAASDAFQHIEPLKHSQTRDQKMIEANLEGNANLAYFADTLLAIAQ